MAAMPFIEPEHGRSARCAARSFLDGLKVVGSQGGAIAAPSGGTTIDLEARTAIGEILAAMREHGLIES